MNFYLAITLVQLYVLSKSGNDAIYIVNRKVVPTHGLEWGQVALVSTIAGVGYSHTFWGTIAFDILMVPVTWVLMDLELNTFIKKNPFTYVGSGWWDNQFRSWSPDHTARSIWIAKAALLIVGVMVFMTISWHHGTIV